MKLLINTASTFKGGSIQVAKSFLEECKRFHRHEYHVVLGASLADVLDHVSFPNHFFFYTIDYRPATRVFSLKSASFFLQNVERKVKPDVVFTTSGPAYWRPDVPHLVGYNLPHYVYPESPFWRKMALSKRWQWTLKGKLIQFYFRRDADAYVVQTEDINKRLRPFLNTDRVYTVSNTCSQHYFKPHKVPGKLPAKEKNEFRLLSLSAWYPHKYLDVIPEVIGALSGDVKQRVRFVLTLPDEDFSKHFPAMKRENIVNVGPVKIEEGPALYQECDALFLPTLLECFSASYAEAMALERPILTSDMGFARTVCHDAALYFDPKDVKDIAKKITLLISSKKLQSELVRKGKERLLFFGAARDRAEKYLKICEELAGN